MLAADHMGQWITILIMSVALGLDAFSLSVGIGLRGIRLLYVLKVSSIIGLFHIVMPLMGIFAGLYVSTLLGEVATTAAGGLLIILGLHMVYSSFQGEESTYEYHTLWGILLFAFMVSIDSFSVGVSLGMFEVDVLLAVITFGLFGMVMSMAGLLIGRRVSQTLGEYGEACGGVILCAFGLLLLF